MSLLILLVLMPNYIVCHIYVAIVLSVINLLYHESEFYQAWLFFMFSRCTLLFVQCTKKSFRCEQRAKHSDGGRKIEASL